MQRLVLKALISAIVILAAGPAVAQTTVFSEDWESGSLGTNGWTAVKNDPTHGGAFNRAEPIDDTFFDVNFAEPDCDFPAADGIWRLLLDVDAIGAGGFVNGAVSTVTTTVDTSSIAGGPVIVSLSWAENFDETHPQDGCFLSDDGVTFTPVIPFDDTRGQNSGFEHVAVDAKVAAPGLNYAGNVFLQLGWTDNTWWCGNDGIQVDRIEVADQDPGPPPPPPTQWTFNLPNGFATLPACFDFESGGFAPEMATTSINVATGLPDPEAWMEVGQTYSRSGLFAAEFGLQPGSTNFHDVRNVIVIGFDGTGHGGPFDLEFHGQNHGEEVDTVDGVWLSGNGTDWFQLSNANGAKWNDLFPTGSGSFDQVNIDLGGFASRVGVSLSGTFYVAFAQEDNFPFNDLDGISLDDVCIDDSVTAGPTLQVTPLVAGGSSTWMVDNANPGDRVLIAKSRGNTPTSFTKFGGVSLDIGPRILILGDGRANQAGRYSTTHTIPASAVGKMIFSQAITVEPAGIKKTNVDMQTIS